MVPNNSSFIISSRTLKLLSVQEPDCPALLSKTGFSSHFTTFLWQNWVFILLISGLYFGDLNYKNFSVWLSYVQFWSHFDGQTLKSHHDPTAVLTRHESDSRNVIRQKSEQENDLFSADKNTNQIFTSLKKNYFMINWIVDFVGSHNFFNWSVDFTNLGV